MTTTVAPQPPVLGRSFGGDRLEELGERDAVADRGRQVGVDPAARAASPADRAGEEIARIILLQHLPVQGRDPEPAVAGAFVVLAHRRTSYAAAPRLPRARAPGLRTSRPGRGRSPRRPAAPGSATPSRRARAASSTRCASAAARCSAETANSPVRGSRSSAATIARAWARLTRPAAIAAARTSWGSSFSASRRSERASRRTCRVSTATQSAAEPAPDSTVASDALGVGEQPQRERFELRPALGEGDQGRALLLGAHRHQRCAASESSRETSRWAKSSTGWRWSTGWLLMDEFKHRPLTEKGL